MYLVTGCSKMSEEYDYGSNLALMFEECVKQNYSK